MANSIQQHGAQNANIYRWTNLLIPINVQCRIQFKIPFIIVIGVYKFGGETNISTQHSLSSESYFQKNPSVLPPLTLSRRVPLILTLEHMDPLEPFNLKSFKASCLLTDSKNALHWIPALNSIHIRMSVMSSHILLLIVEV